MRHLTTFLCLLPAAASVAAAANLAQNSRFDHDVTGWIASPDATIQHSPVDESGSPASGSLELVSLEPGLNLISARQCVSVVPGRTYAIGASVRLGEVVGFGVGYVGVTWSSMENCAVTDLPTDEPLPYFVRLLEAWGTSQRWTTAPAGAQSATLTLRASSSNPADDDQPFSALLDNVFFLEDQTCARPRRISVSTKAGSASSSSGRRSPAWWASDRPWSSPTTPATSGSSTPPTSSS